jgi:hypothetical protein
MQENLFHMPNTPVKLGRGRPRIEISEEKHKLICAALRGGMSANAVGRSFGIDPKTVRKYFYRLIPMEFYQLQQAVDRARALASELQQIADDLALLAGNEGDSE